MTRATQIIQSIKVDPEEWKSNGYNLKNNGTSVWIAHWLIFVQCESDFNENPCTFNLLEKFNIWRTYKKWQKRPVDEKTND